MKSFIQQIVTEPLPWARPILRTGDMTGSSQALAVRERISSLGTSDALNVVKRKKSTHPEWGGSLLCAKTAMKGVGILFGSIKKSIDFLQKVSFRLTEMMIDLLGWHEAVDIFLPSAPTPFHSLLLAIPRKKGACSSSGWRRWRLWGLNGRGKISDSKKLVRHKSTFQICYTGSHWCLCIWGM